VRDAIFKRWFAIRPLSPPRSKVKASTLDATIKNRLTALSTGVARC